LKVYYGSVEYFEREIIQYLSEHPDNCADQEELSAIASRLEGELMHDFICDERLRTECLENLECACKKVTYYIFQGDYSKQLAALCM
jgi:hypothetical protein